ncbi:hypothetical protein KIN20_013057 [Parelaphostrongylus tenuis]|uniref:Uncharacterized protein n=1 Tax=Parelaphostrongylus tenuis TaxID=148309 RepID=A0AAD5MXN2_PARTN|nr:hypothetical protein KIN20_013057 [Parelaphostrongylus tenuis]
MDSRQRGVGNTTIDEMKEVTAVLHDSNMKFERFMVGVYGNYMKFTAPPQPIFIIVLGRPSTPSTLLRRHGFARDATESSQRLRRTDLCAARVELPGCDEFCPLKRLVALPNCYGLNFGLCDRVFCQLVSCNRQEYKVQILYMGYTKQCDEAEQ